MKTLAELLAEYERRRMHADRTGATAPVWAVYDLVIEELERVAGDISEDLTTADVAGLLKVCPTTVARKAAAGAFPGARKTSGETGDWRIPREAVEAFRRGEADARLNASEPWEV